MVDGPSPAEAADFPVAIYKDGETSPIREINLTDGQTSSVSLEPGQYTIEETETYGAKVIYAPGNTFKVAVGCSQVWAEVKNVGEEMTGSSIWELYWVASGNPKPEKGGILVTSGTIPALKQGEVYRITYDAVDNPHGAVGNYMFRAEQRPGHPGTSELWSEAITVEYADSPNEIEITITNTFAEEPVDPQTGTVRIVKRIGSEEGEPSRELSSNLR